MNEAHRLARVAYAKTLRVLLAFNNGGDLGPYLRPAMARIRANGFTLRPCNDWVSR